MASAYRAALVTVSDSVAQGTRQDLSGAVVARLLEAAGWTVRSTEVLPDDFTLLRERLAALTSDVDVDAVFTTGGTGVGPRDRTPEATTAVMERSLPGLAELMRREGMKKTPLAALSRAVVGVKGKTVLVNLPGAPEGAEDSLRAVLPLLPHAVGLLRGEPVHPAAAAPAPLSEPVPDAPVEVEPASSLEPAAPAGDTPAAEEPLGNDEPV
ncbi:MAG: MogA/MoaB family molybdenum cofactor biosynthesis protein [Candidatus Acidiferrales bacterium]